ncbi:hypothetical protein SESBI_00502 [Sesbania bispinosa]|nr:hypothetical protein SESBI_00502 [Sesbania bispinosa]
MENESLLPKQTYGGIKRYLRRRRYQRLDDGAVATGGRKAKILRLRRSPRRYWKIKAVPKMTWVMIRSPLKMLTKLKNAYVNFMLRSMNTDNLFGTKRIPKAREVSHGAYYSRDAFEARLIFEISKALVASHELHPM